MKSRILQLIFGTLCTLFTAHGMAYDGVCKFLFANQPTQQSLFSNIESLEDQYKAMLIDATSSYGLVKDKHSQKTLDLIVQQIQSNQKTIERATDEALNGELLESFKDIQMVETNHRLLNDRLTSLTSKTSNANKNFEWQDIVENPLLLKPNKLYALESPTGIPIALKFSKSVLNDFFFSNQPLEQMASKKILRAMTRYVGSTDSRSSGLAYIKASKDKDVYEVRIIGHAVGAIRVAGVKENGVIHIVHVDQHGTHNSTFSNHLIRNAISKFEHEYVH